MNTDPAVPPCVAETKQLRKDLDELLQKLKPNPAPENHRSSRERSLAVTKIQEAVMWLGMDLRAMREEGIPGCENPYPESKNPDSPTIEKTADNLKL